MEEDNKKEEEQVRGEASGAGPQTLEALKEDLAKAERAAQENLAGWQRAKADFLNYKKDQERMLEELRRYANLDILRALLPTVDSFELATRHLPPELEDSDWAKGVLCIKGMFENFLRETGLREIEAQGKKFDPHFHEALGEVESDQPEETVIEEVQKGYMLGDRVIRPARVKIAKKK
jgi:molecular chaperone GrpE